MKTISLFLIFNSLFMSSALAHAPTLDSLLRNGENPDVGQSTVLASVRIKNVGVDSEDNPVVNNQALKYLIYNEDENAPRLIQLEFAANSLKDDDMYRVRSFPFGRLTSISKNTEKIEQKLFYSVLALLLRNDGSLIMELLKSQGFPVKTNRELVNTEKLKLLNSYKYYLRAQKDGNEKVKNPLNPESSEEKAGIQKIFNSPYILEDGLVKMHKNGDHFNWVVNTGSLYISFDHDHRIEELTFETSAGKFSVVFGRFLLQGAGMEFPEEVVFKTPGKNEYKLELVSLKKFADNTNAQSKRMSRYLETIRKNNISNDIEMQTLTL